MPYSQLISPSPCAPRANANTRNVSAGQKAWERNLKKLKRFKERFGHCQVTAKWKEDTSLGGWVSSQRILNKRGLLRADRKAILDDLGFAWSAIESKPLETWVKWYLELEKFVLQHGHSNVPRTHSDSRLASWVWTQRIRRNRPYRDMPILSAAQIAMLDKLNFSWTPREDRWFANFEELKTFKATFGHCHVELERDGRKHLLNWIQVQRMEYHSGTLDAARFDMLNEIGMAWDGKIENRIAWMEIYNRLKAYYLEHGTANVEAMHDPNRTLAVWSHVQRKSRSKGKLDENQIRLLDELGFKWSIRTRGTWEEKFDLLASYQKKHGHCRVKLSENNPKGLGPFVNRMRVSYSKGQLSKERIAKLESIGFIWKVDKTKTE